MFSVLSKFIGNQRAAGSSDSVVRLERAKIPEKRSRDTIVGDLTDNISHLIGYGVSSGTPVNEKSAMSVAAVTACVSLLADMVAKLPLYLYRKTSKGPEEVTNHPAIRLLSGKPSDLHTGYELRQMMETGKGLGGNGYARVYRNSAFDPVGIEWLAPCDVNAQLIKQANGQKFVAYYVTGESNVLLRDEIVHIRGISRNGYTGISPITMLRESIGTALSQTQAAATLMKNGAKFPGFLVSATQLKKEVLDDARDEFNANYSGFNNAGKVPILNGNFDFKQTNGMSMADAQFIESRRFELQEIARLYRIPAFMIGDSNASNWGTGIEQQTLGFLNFCLDPHLVGWEQSLAMTLLSADEIARGYYFKFDRDEVASVALEARANFYKAMREMQVLSANEVRSELGYATIPDEGMDAHTNPAIAPKPETTTL